MKIIHNIFLSVSEEKRRAFASIGIEMECGFSSFKIDESDSKWPEVEKLSKQFEAIDTLVTNFSAKELKAADYLQLESSWHHGYPEPSDDFRYLNEVYDTSFYCPSCGIGLVQKSPFKFLKEPKWGAKHIMQLNWIFGEFFVQPKVWSDVFKPLGISCREVLHFKTGEKLTTVVQIVIPESEVNLLMDFNEAKEVCSVCSRTKFVPHVRGFFPSLEYPVKKPIFKPKVFFGSGCEARKAVIVNRELYLSMCRQKIKGVVYKPLF